MTNEIITPFRFAIVEEGLYRGAYPTTKNFTFLKRLKLRTIVSLIPEPPNKELLQFCEKQKIINKHFPVPKFKEEDSKVRVQPSSVAQILQVIINTKNLPLFIHCLDGAHNSGVLIMSLRKLQNWNLLVIFSEFTRFTRDSEIHSNESEFVEMFKREILIPTTIPKWLWQGQVISKHPTLKIRLLPEEEEKDKSKKKEAFNKKTVHAYWKDPSDESKSSLSENMSRNLQALALEPGML